MRKTASKKVVKREGLDPLLVNFTVIERARLKSLAGPHGSEKQCVINCINGCATFGGTTETWIAEESQRTGKGRFEIIEETIRWAKQVGLRIDAPKLEQNETPESPGKAGRAPDLQVPRQKLNSTKGKLRSVGREMTQMARDEVAVNHNES